ncbi:MULTISPECIES: EthD family reductase [unclassified Hyphomicrobium]|uniref:EthD family reductase n=1 Tax=unclassified Hyphomicrobium TaxID=2619925 RepID=UPI000213D3AD|nr:MULTISPECIES: EthD family reductase [unclassified Hyphomicrobium]CCB66818.1 Uncharacterized 11.0 kDa protein in thcB-thcC intergenic region [Hyphomicrobium sp. MC1]
MIRLTIVYGLPNDGAAFDAHYQNIHCKLVDKMPRVQSFCYSRGPVISSDASKPAYLIAFLDYESNSDLEASMNSDEGKAAVADVANFADGGVTIFTTEI